MSGITLIERLTPHLHQPGGGCFYYSENRLFFQSRLVFCYPGAQNGAFPENYRGGSAAFAGERNSTGSRELDLRFTIGG